MVSDAAYGFRIAGGPSGGWLAVHGAEHWPQLTLTRDASVSRDDEARVDWTTMRADICADIPADEIVHPLLGRMLPLLAHMRGIDALHGGALLGADGAWVVIGTREAGKSSLLAQCHRHRAQVVSDDIVVVEGMRCLAGPRFIDLRPDAAPLLGPGEVVRAGSKRRLRLPPMQAEVRLAGVIHLAWGPPLELHPLRPAERLSRLAALRNREGWPRDASLVLDLAVLPAFELRRPHGLESLADSAGLLMNALKTAGAMGRAWGG
jgi:hypothetical protein